jgi:SAM-dependent methyltransferase
MSPLGLDLPAAINQAAWERHARQRVTAADIQPAAVTARFTWTQSLGRGPGLELLGDIQGRHVVELGCGPGNNLAHLARLGAHAVGVDISPTQIIRACARWRHLSHPPLFVASDARWFLATIPATFDACYSVFGVLGLCPSDELLPLINMRLRPGGHLAFSIRHPGWEPVPVGEPQLDCLVLPDGSQKLIVRYRYTVPGWVSLLEHTGFATTDVIEVNDPCTDQPCCLIIAATKV